MRPDYRLSHGIIFSPKFVLMLLVALFLTLAASAQNKYQLLKSFGFPALSTGSQPYNQLILGNDGMLYGTTIFGGNNNFGVVFRMNTNGSNYEVLHSFTGNPDGENPESGLLLGSDGLLYGTTANGGTNEDGTIFRLNANGDSYAVVHNLAEEEGRGLAGALIEGREDGFLYGTAPSGGPLGFYGPGTVYKLSKDGSSFSVLCNMTIATGEGPSAALLEANDGLLYGTTSSDGNVNGVTGNGVVFRVSRSGGVPQALYGFMRNNIDALSITGPLIQGSDDLLYGVSKGGGNPNPGQFAYLGCGTIFRLTTDGNNYQQIFLFPTSAEEGYTPMGAPLFGQDGRLYGTTSLGGANNSGTIYALNANGSGFTVLHSLTRTEGYDSMAGLSQATNGTLFGTAANGGALDNGTAFSLSPNGSGIAVIHNFDEPTGGDGTQPGGPLAISGNTAYGTTSAGAAANLGEVFSINLDGTGYAQLHQFTNGTSDGGTGAGVIVGRDGNLYGTLPSFGAYQSGAIFKLTTNGTYSILHEFGSVANDGASPSSPLLQGHDGFLYGVTSGGGSDSSGTVFKISTNGMSYSILWQFNGGTEGDQPVGALIQGANNLLYGATAYAGKKNGGTVFRLNTNGGNFTSLHAFPASSFDGSQPQAGLLIGQDGLLYGTTQGGGTNGVGTAFRMNLNGSGEEVIYAFAATTDGENPTSPLVQAANGKLYGVTANGGVEGDGVVFFMNPDGSGYANQHVFAGPDGLNPANALAIGPGGFLYGAVSYGTPSNFGGIYRIIPGVIAAAPFYTPTNATLNFMGGVPGDSYAISVSSNLVTWSSLTNAVADTNGNIQVTDPNIAGQPKRYYRSFGP